MSVSSIFIWSMQESKYKFRDNQSHTQFHNLLICANVISGHFLPIINFCDPSLFIYHSQSCKQEIVNECENGRVNNIVQAKIEKKKKKTFDSRTIKLEWHLPYQHELYKKNVSIYFIHLITKNTLFIIILFHTIFKNLNRIVYIIMIMV